MLMFSEFTQMSMGRSQERAHSSWCGEGSGDDPDMLAFGAWHDKFLDVALRYLARDAQARKNRMDETVLCA